MLEIKFVRQNLSLVQTALSNRGASVDMDLFKTWDERRRTTLFDIEELRRLRNTVSDKIAQMKRAGEPSEDLILQMREVAEKIKTLEKYLSEDEERVHAALMDIPNIPHESVPIGKNETENVVLQQVGEKPTFDFTPKPHWEIGEGLKILDFERAAKITGARFPLYFGAGARLERALINFMLDIHTQEHGYLEVLPPFIVNRNSMTHTGQLPKFREDLFKLEGWDYFMIPTA